MKLAIKQAEYDNFHEMLVYINTINRPTKPNKVIDFIKLLQNIHKAILVYNNFLLYIANLD